MADSPNLTADQQAVVTQLETNRELVKKEMSKPEIEVAEQLVALGLVSAEKVPGQRHTRAYVLASPAMAERTARVLAENPAANSVLLDEQAARLAEGQISPVLANAGLSVKQGDVLNALAAHAQMHYDFNEGDATPPYYKQQLVRLGFVRVTEQLVEISDAGRLLIEAANATAASTTQATAPAPVPCGLSFEQAGRLFRMSTGGGVKLRPGTDAPASEPYRTWHEAKLVEVVKMPHSPEKFLRALPSVADELRAWVEQLDGQPLADWLRLSKMIDEEQKNARLVANGHPDKQTYEYARNPADVAEAARIARVSAGFEQASREFDEHVSQHKAATAASTTQPAEPGSGTRPAGSNAGFYAVNFTPSEAVCVWFSNGQAARTAVARLGNTSSHVIAAAEFDERDTAPHSFINKMNLMSVPYRVATAFGPAPAVAAAPVAAPVPKPASTPAADISPRQLEILPALPSNADEAAEREVVELAERLAGGWVVGGRDFAQLDGPTQKALGRMMSAGLVKSEFDNDLKKSVYKLTPTGAALVSTTQASEQNPTEKFLSDMSSGLADLKSAVSEVLDKQRSEAPAPVADEPAVDMSKFGRNGEQTVHEYLLGLAPTLTPAERSVALSIGYAGKSFSQFNANDFATAASLCRKGAIYIGNRNGGNADRYVIEVGLPEILAKLAGDTTTEKPGELVLDLPADPAQAVEVAAKLADVPNTLAPGQAAESSALAALRADAWPATTAERTRAAQRLALDVVGEKMLASMPADDGINPAAARVLAATAGIFLTHFDAATAGEVLPRLAALGVDFVAVPYSAEVPSAVSVSFALHERDVTVFVALTDDAHETEYTTLDEMLDVLSTTQAGRAAVSPLFVLAGRDVPEENPIWVPVVGRPEFSNLDALLARLAEVFDYEASSLDEATDVPENVLETLETVSENAETVPAPLAVAHGDEWLKVPNAKRAHYFEAGQAESICGDWRTDEQTPPDIFAGAGMTHCAKCEKMLAKGADRWFEKLLPSVVAAIDKACGGLATELLGDGVTFVLVGPVLTGPDKGTPDNATGALVLKDAARHSLKVGVQLIEVQGGERDVFVLSYDGEPTIGYGLLDKVSEIFETTVRRRFKRPRPVSAVAVPITDIPSDEPTANYLPDPLPKDLQAGDVVLLRAIAADSSRMFMSLNGNTRPDEELLAEGVERRRQRDRLLAGGYIEPASEGGCLFYLLTAKAHRLEAAYESMREQARGHVVSTSPAELAEILGPEIETFVEHYKTPASTTATGDELLGTDETTPTAGEILDVLGPFEGELLLDLALDPTGEDVFTERLRAGGVTEQLKQALAHLCDIGLLDSFIEWGKREELRGVVKMQPAGMAFARVLAESGFGRTVRTIEYRRKLLGLSSEDVEALELVGENPLATLLGVALADMLCERGLIDVVPASHGIGEHYVLTDLGRSVLPVPPHEFELTPQPGQVPAVPASTTEPTFREQTAERNRQQSAAFLALSPAARELAELIDRDPFGTYAELTSRIPDDERDTEAGEARADRRELRDELLNADIIWALSDIDPLEAVPTRANCYRLTYGAKLALDGPPPVEASEAIAPVAEPMNPLAACGVVGTYFAKFLSKHAGELYKQLTEAEVLLDCYELAEGTQASQVIISLQGPGGRRYGIEFALRDDAQYRVLKTAVEQATALAERGGSVVPMVLEKRGATSTASLQPLDGLGVLNNLAGSVAMYFNLGTMPAGATEAEHPVADSVRRFKKQHEPKPSDNFYFQHASGTAEQLRDGEGLPLYPEPLPLPHGEHGGPAFPGTVSTGDGGTMSWPGLSARLYLAAHAPAEVPTWFNPGGPRPTFDMALDFERVLAERFGDTKTVCLDEIPAALAEAAEQVAELGRAWDVRRLAAWPLYWADLILAKEAAGK